MLFDQNRPVRTYAPQQQFVFHISHVQSLVQIWSVREDPVQIFQRLGKTNERKKFKHTHHH